MYQHANVDTDDSVLEYVGQFLGSMARGSGQKEWTLLLSCWRSKGVTESMNIIDRGLAFVKSLRDLVSLFNDYVRV